jgi:thiamine-phosphate pyrophosphorylase
MQNRSSVGERGALWAAAQALNLKAGLARPLPPLFFVTDPDRTPDPGAIAERLPAGAGVLFRGFGRPGAEDAARRLAEIARRRGLTLLVGLDGSMAEAVGAHGVHLPEKALSQAPALRARRPDFLITGAVHSAAALERAAEAGLDAALLSPVFASASPSAGAPLGVERFSELVAGARLPVYALGGIDSASAGRLAHSGAAGLAAVEGVLSEYAD